MAATVVLIADVVARCPELAAVDATEHGTEWAAAIEDASLEVDDAVWGARAKKAACYLAAHLMALAFPGKVSSGPLQSFSAGAVSKSYAVATAHWRNELDNTKWGQMFNGLCRVLPAAYGNTT